MHYTETCEKDRLHAIINVHTVPGTDQDVTHTHTIHRQLAAKSLLPAVQYVDAGYTDGLLFISLPRDYGVTLFGPTRGTRGWQSKTEGAYTLDDFQVDWDQQVAICPQGKQSRYWGEYQRTVRGKARHYTRAVFAKSDCTVCPMRGRCTRHSQRALVLTPRASYEALQAAKARLKSEAGQAEYARRAGVEGTFSQGLNIAGLRHSRYQGMPKTHLQNVAIAAALNLVRAVNFLGGKPQHQVRPSRFVRLQA